MKNKTLYHFAHLTKEREKKLAIFESLSPAQYDDMSKKARAEFNAQNITAERGRLNFKGCTISQDADGFRVDICAHSPDLGYINDTIYNINGSIKTADGIETAIFKRIEELTERAKHKTEILTHSAQIYEETAAALIEIVNKYGTPSNKLGVYIPYFKYTVEEIFQCL